MLCPMSGKPTPVRALATNKRARHDYEILDTFEAGMELSGTEVKAARNGKVQLKDSYVEFRDGQAFLVGAHISHYSHGNRENHEPERPRRLLLKKREIEKLFGRTLLKGFTVVPLSMYLKGNWLKVELALAQGKKLYDKRQTERAKTLDREAEEAVKERKWLGRPYPSASFAASRRRLPPVSWMRSRAVWPPYSATMRSS
ncbi:MAG: SsrA-binding protein [Acidobacteriota bacterium]|jgi:SsrA-binding protein|nr:SsrA-binding protein [Acidobacteriota bacterium]